MVYKEVNEADGKVFFLHTTEKAKKTVLSHKAYDNRDNVKTRKKLLETFTVDEMVAFDKILKAYTDILEKNNSKNKPL